jgi:Pilus biogenesis CpaD protein (pilus_cpaD)
MKPIGTTVRHVGAIAVATILLAQTSCTYSGPPPPTAGQPCPPWADDPPNPHSNAESPYLGCVNRVNLKDMVDNPNDLQQGRTLGPADGTREANGVRAYEQGQIKPFANPNAPPAVLFTPGLTTGTTGGNP